ncbi:MAG: helix-turn-helix domain-containing protein [Pseudomonadota bacterium]
MPASYDRHCPLARTAPFLEGRWNLLILREFVRNGPRRFQDLQQALIGIPPTTLSDRLKTLENAGVISKEIYDMSPPRAHYKLTEAGEELRPIIRALRAWGERHTSI